MVGAGVVVNIGTGVGVGVGVGTRADVVDGAGVGRGYSP